MARFSVLALTALVAVAIMVALVVGDAAAVTVDVANEAAKEQRLLTNAQHADIQNDSAPLGRRTTRRPRPTRHTRRTPPSPPTASLPTGAPSPAPTSRPNPWTATPWPIWSTASSRTDGPSASTPRPNPWTATPWPIWSTASARTDSPPGSTTDPWPTWAPPSTRGPRPTSEPTGRPTRGPRPTSEPSSPSTSDPWPTWAPPSTRGPRPTWEPPSSPSTRGPRPTWEPPSSPSTRGPRPTWEPTPSTRGPRPTWEPPSSPSTRGPRPTWEPPSSPSTSDPWPTSDPTRPTRSPTTRDPWSTSEPTTWAPVISTTSAPRPSQDQGATIIVEGWSESPPRVAYSELVLALPKPYHTERRSVTWSNANLAVVAIEIEDLMGTGENAQFDVVRGAEAGPADLQIDFESQRGGGAAYNVRVYAVPVVGRW